MRFKTISVLLLLLLGIYHATWAGDVTVTPMSSSEVAYFMSNLSKIGIYHDEKSYMVFYDKQGVIIANNEITAPSRITLDSQTESAVDDVDNDNTDISFYPNPSTDFIHITGLQNPTLAKIYNLNGQLLLSTMDSSLNVSSLTAGSYVLQVGSHCFKVIIQ